jgi:hypothetical protein
MNSKRFFFVMLGAVILLVAVLIATVVAGDGLLQKRSQKLIGLKLDNRLLDEQQVALVQANKDIVKYSDLEQTAKTIVPQDKDQAEAVREIVKIANDNGIKLGTISFPASTLGQTVAPPAASSSSGSSATKVVLPPVTQVTQVSGIPGLYVMDINIQQDATAPVTYNKFIAFLNSLEQNRRTSQVTSVTVQPTADDRNKLTFSLVVDVYIKP